MFHAGPPQDGVAPVEQPPVTKANPAPMAPAPDTARPKPELPPLPKPPPNPAVPLAKIPGLPIPMPRPPVPFAFPAAPRTQANVGTQGSAAKPAPVNLAMLMPALFPKEVSQPLQQAAQQPPATNRQAPIPSSLQQSAGEQGMGGAQQAAAAVPAKPQQPPGRATLLASFYSIGQTSAAQKQEISEALQTAMMGSPRAAGPAAAAVTGAQEEGQAPRSADQIAAVAPAAVQQQMLTEALSQPVIPAAEPAPASRPAMRLHVPQPAARAAYMPHLGGSVMRPYRPPLAPNPMPSTSSAAAMPPPSLIPPVKPAAQPQPTAPGKSYTDMLLSTIRPKGPGPGPQGQKISPQSTMAAAEPGTSPRGQAALPRPGQQQPPPNQAKQQQPAAAAAGLTRSNSLTSNASEASTGASDGSVGKKRICTMCKSGRANYLVLPCKDWGPCVGCVPSPEEFQLYPTCLRCNGKASTLFRVWDG